MFDNFKTSAEVKAEYMRLLEVAALVGTDFGDLDKAYLGRLEELSGQITMGTDGKEHTYRYNEKTEKKIQAALQALLALKMDNVKIELVGTWVWASGDTRPHKEELKKAGLIWHGKRKLWYWRVRGGPRKYTGLPFNDLRKLYGSKEYKPEESQKPQEYGGQF